MIEFVKLQIKMPNRKLKSGCVVIFWWQLSNDLGELCVVRIHGNSYRPRNSHMSEDPQTNQRECLTVRRKEGIRLFKFLKDTTEQRREVTSDTIRISPPRRLSAWHNISRQRCRGLTRKWMDIKTEWHAITLGVNSRQQDAMGMNGRCVFNWQ